MPDGAQRRKNKRLKLAGVAPFGLGHNKPHHYLEMFKIAGRNLGKLGYAWRVLNEGVCDGCALGTIGLKDWTIDGTHLCLVRLNLLELNTMDAFDPVLLKDPNSLPVHHTRELRELGRIPYPMRRRAGERGFERISWDDAIAEIGAKMAATDPNRFACYMTSRGIGNEVYFATQKAVRAYGSPHIDNAARLCHSPSTSAMKATMGVAASTCSYKDWYSADVIVFFGSNPANDQPVALKYLYEAKKRGARVLVVNTYEEPGMKRYWIPSNADSAVFGTRVADRFFSVTSGGDQAFAYAVQKVLIDRGAVDQSFIDEHTRGWDELVEFLSKHTVADLAKRAGTTEQEVIDFANEIEAANTGVFVWSMGLTQHSHGSKTIEAVCGLGLSQGFVGREGCGLMPIRGHSGVQGGAEMGAYATVFPGGPITEAEGDRLEQLWGFRPPVQTGMDTVEMLMAAERGDLDVLYAIGGNFVDTLPDPERIAAAVENVPVRVHQDIVLTPKMFLEPKEAVYLLPAKTRYEHIGGITETTTERRVIYSPFIGGHDVGEAREEWRIAVDLAKAARPERAEFLHYEDAAAIREDISRTIPAYAPIKDLKQSGDNFQWGGRRLADGGEFPLPGGKAQFTHSEPPDRGLSADQFHLGTRRGKQFNSLIQNDHDHLTGADRDHLFMSEEDANRMGFAPNQAVVVKSVHGRTNARVFVAPITPGNVQMHWPEANVLIEAGPVDAGGKVPDYNAVVTVTAHA